MTRHPELLIPASSLEVLKTAVIFGADAVYICNCSVRLYYAPVKFQTAGQLHFYLIVRIASTASPTV